MSTKKKQAQEVAASTCVFLPDVAFMSEIFTSSNVTSSSQRIGWQISKHNIPNIWLDTQGKGVTVAVLDTGTDVYHPDLIGVVTRTWDVYKRKEQAIDRNGHGIHTTGIIAANNNKIGMVGVSPEAKTMAIKVLGDDGSGTMAGVAAGIRFAIQNKADIISLSLGGPKGDTELHDAIKEAYNLNIPIICAAGNSGDRGVVAYPARYPETIAIGALNSQNLRAEFSQTGTRLDFMAPGVDIFSTYIGGYRVLSGTSMATPWVAGVVALMMAKHRLIGGKTPLHSVEDIREHLKKTAIDLDKAGKDVKTGYGLIDVSKALETMVPEPVQPIADPEPVPDPVAPPEPEPVTPEPTIPDPEPVTPEPEPTIPDPRVDQLESQVNQLESEAQASKVRIEALTGRITRLESKLGQIKGIL